ncbi:hypothetical protein BTVI_48640 [Pitangus sulphuratus]|nr:hypothetical protein BTVI_48640 [Pitangus sulphuratus]
MTRSIAESVEDPEEGISSTHRGQTLAQKGRRRSGVRTGAQTAGTGHMLVPLHQIIALTGTQAKVKAPFSASDLNSWREEAECCRENPEKVAKRFELIAKNQEMDWTDIDLMLLKLTETEKELVIKTTRREVVSQIATGVLTGDVDQIFPLQQLIGTQTTQTIIEC